jgi:MFS family permease
VPASARPAAQAIVLPLALAQFIASYAATNMNVAISTIATDIGTTVVGMQTAITLFTLTMAALMIPGSKLTEIWGRKFCFVTGLVIYGTGALIAALAQGLGLIILGYSILEGVGSALLIPPIYILITVAFADARSRARNFGVVSGAAGLGAAAGPLIGGVITSAVSWRASFGIQVVVVASVIVLARRIADPGITGPRPAFDLGGALLSAAGLVCIVLGILQTGTHGWASVQVWLFIGIGAVTLAWFFWHIRARQRAGKDPLLPTRTFTNRTANLGLGTQIIQWLTLQGSFFVISVLLQEERGFSAIASGLALTPATAGILLSSASADRFARRHSQPWLIRVGFVVTSAGMILLLVLGGTRPSAWALAPGLLLMGLGVGVMLTSSVNVVQSSFPESEQGDISGLSRSVSNLGSSLGVALAGSILVAASGPGSKPFGLAATVLLVVTLAGLVLALLLPAGNRVLPRPE